jgi:hypothetical protein
MLDGVESQHRESPLLIARVKAVSREVLIEKEFGQ